MSLGDATYPTRAEADRAPARTGTSQACDNYKHRECGQTRPPTQIEHGPRTGLWFAAWACSCPCHTDGAR